MVYFECFLRYNINGPNDDGQCILIDIFFDAGDFSRSCSITSSLKPPSLNLSDSWYFAVSSIVNRILNIASDSNYLLWKCNSRLIKKKHQVDSIAASIPFEQLNSQIQYYLSFLDNEIKRKIENFKQIDSSSGTGIHRPLRLQTVESRWNPNFYYEFRKPLVLIHFGSKFTNSEPFLVVCLVNSPWNPDQKMMIMIFQPSL